MYVFGVVSVWNSSNKLKQPAFRRAGDANKAVLEKYVQNKFGPMDVLNSIGEKRTLMDMSNDGRWWEGLHPEMWWRITQLTIERIIHEGKTQNKAPSAK